jgi:phosphate starvation-inducible membrane PsiE
MQGSLDTSDTERTGPHSDLPPVIARAVTDVGVWIRYTLIVLIAVMTLVATAMSVADIVKSGRVTIADVLLLFIYLEISAMIFVEATTRRLPVNFIIYIAITALTRHLVGVAGDKTTSDLGLLIDAAAILVLVIAAVLLDWKLFMSTEKTRAQKGM